MDDLENKLELVKIGGLTMYNKYVQDIKDYLRENPGKTETEIANGAGVPLIAVKRALRDGVIEYSLDALDRGSPEDRRRAETIRALRKAFQEQDTAIAEEKRYHGSQFRRDLDVRGKLKTDKDRDDR